MDDHNEATNAPITANETIAAAGMTALCESKCFLANTYAKVGDLLNVSITNARLDFSLILLLLVKANATPPPTIGRRHDAIMDEICVTANDAAVLLAPPATKINVAITPSGGHQGTILDTIFGMNLPQLNPTTRGHNDNFVIDSSTSRTFIGIELPSNNWISMGVAITPSIVVVKVHTTDKATSPPESKVNKFDAWPPLTDPSKMMPAASLLLKPNIFDSKRAMSGIIPKQYAVFVVKIDACFKA